MFTHTYIVSAAALLAIPMTQFIQCERVEPSVPCGGDIPAAAAAAKLEELGKQVFFDEISVPKRMSCATCHDPAAGWTFKNAGINQKQVGVTGANPHEAGTLKPPSSAYASFVPKFGPCGAFSVFPFCGGAFWNGRSEGNPVPTFEDFPQGATRNVGDEVFGFKAGNVIGAGLKDAYAQYLGPLADQALNPFANPKEQNIEERMVCEHVAKAKYAPLFAAAWGEAIDCSEAPYAGTNFKAHEVNFRRLAVALAAWQSSSEVNSFSSKRDKALAADADGKFPLDGFTAEENLGHDLFYNRLPNLFAPEGAELEDGSFNVRPFPDLPITNCSICHISSADALDGTDPFERYTDDGYHNIGTPKNEEIPAPGAGEVLPGHTGDPNHAGLVKTPTLRNVDKRPGKGFTKAYTHNGWFKSLESLVHYYNTADVNPQGTKLHTVTRCPEGVKTEKQALAQNCWPAPEFAGTSAVGLLFGNLGLTPKQEAALVAYLRTFTDTETPKPPKPYK